MKRRLAAILAADVVGYTRLMGADEAGTLQRFTELRHQSLEPLIAEHHGRIFKLMGDGLLVEFASVVDALLCAAAWHKSVAAAEATVDEGKRLMFRIGVNLVAPDHGAHPLVAVEHGMQRLGVHQADVIERAANRGRRMVQRDQDVGLRGGGKRRIEGGKPLRPQMAVGLARHQGIEQDDMPGARRDAGADMDVAAGKVSGHGGGIVVVARNGMDRRRQTS